MNKVAAAVQGRIPQPRPKTRIAHMTGDSALVTSKYVSDVVGTTVSAQVSTEYLLNPSLNAAANDAGGTVMRNYQEYAFDKAVIEFTPAVGTTTPGTLWIGYYDNPEIMLKAFAGTYSNAERLALAKQSPISSCGPIWMPQSLPAAMSRRRAKYASDSTPPTDRFQMDLTTHGVWLVATEGVPLETAVGVFSVHYTVRGYHLENNSIAGV